MDSGRCDCCGKAFREKENVWFNGVIFLCKDCFEKGKWKG